MYKVGEVNSLVAEVTKVSAKEHALLGHCKDLLSTIAAMQVYIYFFLIFGFIIFLYDLPKCVGRIILIVIVFILQKGYVWYFVSS